MKPLSFALLSAAGLASSALFFSSCSEGQAQTEEKSDKAAAPAVPALPASPVPSAEGAKCYIISPKDGETVGKTFTVQFGLKGMGVAPATVYLEGQFTGHHHLVLDADLPDMKLPFPMSDNYLHFGGGQTETELTLEPGEHTLQLVLGDHNHVPHDPPVVSEKITVTVE